MVGQSKEDKNFVFTYIHGYVCVYMSDGPKVWVFAFIKSARVFSYDIGDNVSHW